MYVALKPGNDGNAMVTDDEVKEIGLEVGHTVENTEKIKMCIKTLHDSNGRAEDRDENVHKHFAWQPWSSRRQEDSVHTCY